MKTLLLYVVLILLGYGLFASSDFAMIASGIAIFLVGMLFMEDGFKLFTGGMLRKILKRTTDTVPKAIMSGFVATALVQSSSLTSVIAISFLSAELLQLSQAVGIIFGANIGTTATAWIVAAFGMKIDIGSYGMPMIVFGVLLSFFQQPAYRGLGKVLLGLGFIFLGIAYMKDGFETLKSGIDLGSYAMAGPLGVAVYILVGMIATVIIQSSSATLALIITALATGQIEYVNALALAIGANIGTTVTAILGALTSNENGKRLAVAHLIFNTVTALVAAIFITQFQALVELICDAVGIGKENMVLRLSVFHTLFNTTGVLLVTPFISPMVRFLETLFLFTGERRGTPAYLDHEVIKAPGPAITALARETMHLYDIVCHTILKALQLRKQEVFSTSELRRVVESVDGTDQVDINAIYDQRIKRLYGAILQYGAWAEKEMNHDQREEVYRIKLASREIVEAVKDIRELQKNLARYMRGENSAIKGEYNFLREKLADTLRTIEKARLAPQSLEASRMILAAKEENKRLDDIATRRLSSLLRDEKINDRMASSLMNDSSYTRMVAKNLLKSAMILWGRHGGEEEYQATTHQQEETIG